MLWLSLMVMFFFGCFVGTLVSVLWLVFINAKGIKLEFRQKK